MLTLCLKGITGSNSNKINLKTNTHESECLAYTLCRKMIDLMSYKDVSA